MPDPSFAELKASIRKLPDSSVRDEAEQVLKVLYVRYNAASPPQFLFNRHGLLHGLRKHDDVDVMNCARMFLLFDLLCYAEGLSRSVIYDETFHKRHTLYRVCEGS